MMLWLGLTSIKSWGRLPSQSVIFIKAPPLRSLSASATQGKWRRLSWQWPGLRAISGCLPPLPNNAAALLTTSTLSTGFETFSFCRFIVFKRIYRGWFFFFFIYLFFCYVSFRRSSLGSPWEIQPHCFSQFWHNEKYFRPLEYLDLLLLIDTKRLTFYKLNKDASKLRRLLDCFSTPTSCSSIFPTVNRKCSLSVLWWQRIP